MREHNRGCCTSLALALLATAVAVPGRAADTSAPEVVKVKGAADHQARRSGASWSLRGPGADGQLVVAGPAGEWLVQDGAGKVVLRARSLPGGQVQVTAPDGRVVRTGRVDGEGVRIYAPDGTLQVRVKVKEDKFNVYDASGKRVRHGKVKDYGFSVKDEAGARELKIEGPRSLREASCFALGLGFAEEVLWWRALDR